DEESLAQGDYDVYVTDARWLESLRIGQSWGTTSYADQTDGHSEDGDDPWEDWREFCAMGAESEAEPCFTLGWLHERRGDVEGAAEAYLRVAEGKDRAQRGKGLLYLGRLREAGGDDEAARALYERAERSKDHERYGARYRSRAALRLGALLRRLGDEEGAREAFGR
ncbi:tetratricopeptide repeat protein, partial [Plantactinospora mayteni]|uniref:tetratricopeptide repeat protein n=1 Tax=Plantactinospora mayteni TaxID=566021 RepID=UPI0031ED40B6